MSVLKTILAVLLVAIVAVLAIAMTKPDSFRVERSITVHAPPERIFGFVNDFHQWPQWSPWEKLDPGMNRDFSGSASGIGAVYGWTGNSKVGAGRMEITQSTPPSKVAVKLDFLRPFESHNITEFVFEPQGGNTRVVWVMHGPTPFVSKLMSVFVSMDTLIGKDFEAGLNNLKAAAEKAPA